MFRHTQRVLVYSPASDVELGCKLRTPWLGPYRIEEVLSPIACMVRSEVGGLVARVRVNRLARMDESVYEPLVPREGVFPDSRRLIQSLQGKCGTTDGLQFKVKLVGRSPRLQLGIAARSPASRDSGARRI